MPSERETNAVPLPCEWPMKPICVHPGREDQLFTEGLLNERERETHLVPAGDLAYLVHKSRHVVHRQLPDRPV